MCSRWAHVMCAVGLPEAKFTDVVKRSPVDVSGVPAQRYKLVYTHMLNRHTFPRLTELYVPAYACPSGVPDAARLHIATPTKGEQ